MDNVVKKYVEENSLQDFYTSYKHFIWPAASYAFLSLIKTLIPEFKACIKDHMVGTFGFNNCRLDYAEKMVHAANNLQHTCNTLEGIHKVACMKNSAKIIDRWNRKVQRAKIALSRNTM